MSLICPSHYQVSGFLAGLVWAAGWHGTAFAAPGVDAIRITGPEQIAEGDFESLGVEVRFPGRRAWVAPNPGELKVEVSGGGRLIPNWDGGVTLPLLVAGERGEPIAITAEYLQRSTSRTIGVGAAAAGARVNLRIDSNQVLHPYVGCGAGAFFYTNLWDASREKGRGEEIFDFCFKDVESQFLHTMIRWSGEPKNDNDSPFELNEAAFDFAADQPAIVAIQAAQKRNRDIQVVATLMSPPPWLKTNDSESGKGGLRHGEEVPSEIAEYVYAYLRYAAERGVRIPYLSLFNEPNFRHSHAGVYFDDFGHLADVQVRATAALRRLIESDPLLEMPKMLFPEVTGAGALTRKESQKNALLARQEELQEAVDIWAVHDYWNEPGYWEGRYAELRELPVVAGKPVWMTEWTQTKILNDVAIGSQYGLRMCNALRLGAQSWMAFEWLHPDFSGLIQVTWTDEEVEYRRTPAYWVIRQLANQSKPGSKVLGTRIEPLDFAQRDSTGVECLALREEDGTIRVHLYNALNTSVDYTLQIEPISGVVRPIRAGEGLLLRLSRAENGGEAQAMGAVTPTEAGPAELKGRVAAHALLSFPLLPGN